jgi:hypothetical protein
MEPYINLKISDLTYFIVQYTVIQTLCKIIQRFIHSVPLQAEKIMGFGSQTYLLDIEKALQFAKSYTEILKAKETYKTNVTVKFAKQVADYAASWLGRARPGIFAVEHFDSLGVTGNHRNQHTQAHATSVCTQNPLHRSVKWHKRLTQYPRTGSDPAGRSDCSRQEIRSSCN